SSSFQKDRANIAICGFNDHRSIENIKKSLIDFGFNNFTIYKADGYYRLRFNHSDAILLFDTIKNIVPDCMQYKLSKKYRGYFKKPVIKKCKKCFFKSYGRISSINIVKKGDFGYKGIGCKKYDITTQTSNFFSGDMLVHNSNALVTYDGETLKAGKRSSFISEKTPNAHFGFSNFVYNEHREYLENIMHVLQD